jgi:hypothetical protein
MSEVYNLNGVFEQLAKPIDYIKGFHEINPPGSILKSSFYNSQRADDVAALLYGENAVNQISTVGRYSLQGFFRMLLDEGFIPRLVGTDGIVEVGDKLRKAVSDGSERSAGLLQLLSVDKFFFEAERMPDISATDFEGVAFLVSTHGDPMTLKYNLESSVDFNNSKNERYIIRGAKSQAEVYHVARHSKKKLLINIHDDLYIPKNWTKRVWQQFFEEDAKSPVGVAGLFGVSGNREWAAGRVESGLVVDLLGMRTLGSNWRVTNTRVLDGLCLVTKNGSGIVPDKNMGFHFYDADMCMTAEASGKRVVSLFAPALHSSYVITGPTDFQVSMEIFKKKWPQMLPVETPCALVK